MVIRLNIGNRRSNLPISVLVAGIFGKKHPQIADLNSFFPKTGNRNVTEIAYAVGFNDPKYFTRCFTKMFGVSPSAFDGKNPNP